jgi:hypothetical protein
MVARDAAVRKETRSSHKFFLCCSKVCNGAARQIGQILYKIVKNRFNWKTLFEHLSTFVVDASTSSSSSFRHRQHFWGGAPHFQTKLGDFFWIFCLAGYLMRAWYFAKCLLALISAWNVSREWAGEKCVAYVCGANLKWPKQVTPHSLLTISETTRSECRVWQNGTSNKAWSEQWFGFRHSRHVFGGRRTAHQCAATTEIKQTQPKVNWPMSYTLQIIIFMFDYARPRTARVLRSTLAVLAWPDETRGQLCLLDH